MVFSCASIKGEAMSADPARMVHSLRAWLPSGIALSRADWSRRHRAITMLGWAHVVLLPFYGFAQGHGAQHVLLECGVVATLAAGAGLRALGTTARSLMATLALVSASAMLVHFSDGVIESHFHFFVVVAVISLYQSWIPFLTALGFVVVHHGVAGQIAPGTVYNHPSAVEHAWLWALVHGVFILAESAACLVAWRLNEIALEGERSARDEMAGALRELANAQALAGVGSWEWDLATDVVTWSDQLYALCGRRRGEFAPSVASFVDHVVAEDRDRVREILDQAVAADGSLEFECAIERADGVVRILHVLGERSDDGACASRLMGTCQDITERTTLQREIEHRTFHDSLTDLPNRAMFLDRLDHALAVSGRTGSRISLLYLDVDDFKTINDNLGHSAGDEVLIALARRLQTVVRDSDTLARLGGDEFVLLLEGTTADAAALVAEKVLQQLHEPLDLASGRRVARVSIGIAVAEDDDLPGDLLRRADIAMYAAKRQGTHGYRVFSDGMHSSMTARMELESELAEAIEQDQLVVHYQPLVDLVSGAIDGVEALVRWDHPLRGMLPPSEFIPVAEEAGLISVLGEWVLRRAASDVRELQRTLHSELYLSVNVAPSQLDSELVSTVQR
ncbi:MAG: diguanylate cyclase, partial [Frankiales bacterium]